MANNPVFINDDYVLAEEPDNNTNSSTLAQQKKQQTIESPSCHDDFDSPMLHEVKSTDTTSLRGYCGTLVTNPLFQKAVVGLIIMNSIQMGVGTYDVVRDNPTMDRAFEVMDNGFLVLFTVELCMQFAYHGVGGVFADGWLTFDVLVIFLSWTLSSFAIIRAFRVVRAVRLVTKIGELKALVQALIGVIPKMFAIGVLLTLVFYIFGVMFTQLFRDAYADGLTEVDYFSSLHRSFFTLFQLMTLENWSYITRDLMTAHPFAWLPMMVFILVSSFIVINLVIAVICDAVANLNGGESEAPNEGGRKLVQSSSGSSSQREEEMARLESKVDHLTQLVHELIRQQQQQQLQATMPSEQQQQHDQPSHSII